MEKHVVSLSEICRLSITNQLSAATPLDGKVFLEYMTPEDFLGIVESLMDKQVIV